MYDILTIGDATLDVFLEISEENADVKCNIREEECQICFDYADKIPVEKITRVVGAGNASNNAVGASRLGMKAAIYSILGDDDTGHAIFDHWKKEGLATTYVKFDKRSGTNYSTVINYRGERTILVYHEKRAYSFPKRLGKAKWVYYTSMGKGSERMHGDLLAYVKRTGAKLCFQPGTHQLKLGQEALKPLISRSEIAIMNKEEAMRLVGNEARSMQILLKRLRALGCKIAVITDGPKGSYTYDGKDFLKLPIFDVPIVERTGCGDAFATAFTAALHYGKDVGEAMRWGTANSASKLGFIGPQAGLLTKKEMPKWLARFADVKIQKL